MPGAYVKIVKLRKWFPPHDPLAPKIARLCILREDLMLEMQGMYADDILELDGLSAASRRMYFLRNLIRTHMELSGAIRRLHSDSEFCELLEKQSAGVKEKFKTALAKLDEAHPLLKEVRNDIGGHVQESAVQAALERMSWDSFGLLDIGPNALLTHYEFAGEITAEILLKDVSQEERLGITSNKYILIAELLPTFALIEYCLGIYAKSRNLLKLYDY